MSSLRLRKISRDLWTNRSRSLLAVIAMTVGMIGLAAVFCAYSILNRELDANYMRTGPASAVIVTNSVDDRLLEGIRRLPGIASVEARGFFPARIMVGKDEWKTLLLFAIDDFNGMRISRVSREEGEWPPGVGDILIERAAMRVIRKSMGDQVKVRIPGMADRELRLAGIAHDPAQAPAWMEGLAYGYVNRATLALFRIESLNEILVLVNDRSSDRTAIRTTMKGVSAWMEQQGYGVRRIDVPEPGHHPHQTQLEALLFLLQAFGGLSFVLSAVLVFTLMGAIMAQQVRQIGIMKAIGGRTGQLAVMYLGGALLLGMIAVVIGVPSGLLVARQYALFAAKMLNFEILDASVPIGTYGLLVLVGLVMPIVAALYPVVRGSRMSVREATGDYGIRTEPRSAGLFEKAIGRSSFLSRPLLLSIRNTFRRRGRFVLTLLTLAIGGAMFITALDTGASIKKSIAAFQGAMRYDLKLSFSRPVSPEAVETIAGAVPGVARVEAWRQAKGSLVYRDGTDGNEFTIMGPPPETALIRPRLLAGRWLRADDKDAMVVNHIFMYQEPGVKLGDEVVLRIGGLKTKVRLVGTIRQIGPPTAIMSSAYLAGLKDQKDQIDTLAIVTEKRSTQAHLEVSRQIEGRFEGTGYGIQELISIYDIQKIMEEHFVVLTALLLIMAILIVIVGGLALASTMSVQVMERTREIGVMRAIGASSADIFRIVVVEALVIGTLSWILAVCLAVPISKYVADLFGMIFLRTTLDFAVSPVAFLLWCGIVLIFSMLASYLPARNATRLTVHETLSYE